jgi:hypothetical protein
MSFWRVVLAWLIMAAVPLQGIAASSMLFCAMSEHHSQEAQAKPAHHGEGSTASGHDHAKHEHEKASTEQAKSKAGSLPDSAHVCGVCGSCSNTAAIVDFAQPATVKRPVQTMEAELFVLIHSPPIDLPEKPPRA